MNDLIKNLLDQLKATSGGTKLIALMGAASFLTIIALVAMVSRKADFTATVFMNMNVSEATKVAQALDAEGIKFQVNSESPYFIKVDESDKTRAQAVAFAANALASAPAGVQTESGMGSIFASADQRGLIVDKLKEEEIENLLSSLSFVTQASVSISEAKTTAISNHNNKPMSVAVIVTVNGPPTAGHQRSLAALVTNATGANPEHVTILDHLGNSLYDGSGQMDQQGLNKELLSVSFDWDEETSRIANEFFAKTYGPNMIRVMVKSEWDFDRSVQRTESSPDSIVTLSTENSTSRAPKNSGGGVVGLGGNTGSNQAADPETTSQKSTTSRPLMTRTDTVINQPRIKHLNVALTIHTSLAEKEDEISKSARGLVGFKEDRDDTFAAMIQDPYTVPIDPDAVVVEETPTSAPNPMLETLMRRGVEVLTASIFILVLMKSLKSANKPAPGEPGSPEAAESEMDLDLLARANVDQLVKSDPERVGEILTSWARGEQTTGAK